MSRSHISTLDGLRGIAVSLVLIAHLSPLRLKELSSIIPQLQHMAGYLGVDLFFVLSGFLITRILLADRDAQVPVWRFYVRRALRIFPVYYTLLLIHFVLAPTPALVWCATYLSNYYFAIEGPGGHLQHTWSLAVEEHFYLFWPMLVYWAAPTRLRAYLYAIMALSVGSSAAIILLKLPHAADLIYSGTFSRAWSLSLGALVAHSQTRQSGWSSAALGIALALVSILLGRVGSPWAFPMQVCGYSLFSTALVLAALRAVDGNGAVRGLLVAPWLRLLGRISYGLYLVHPFVFAYVFRHRGGWLLFVLECAAGLAGSIAVAWASWTFFEGRILALRDSWVESPKSAR